MVNQWSAILRKYREEMGIRCLPMSCACVCVRMCVCVCVEEEGDKKCLDDSVLGAIMVVHLDDQCKS